MLKVDRWIGLFFILLSAYVCGESLRLGLGTVHMPGPGFLSFCTGLILGLMAIALVVTSLVKEGRIAEGFKKWTGALLVILSLFGFVFILDTLGFILSTFLFMTFVLRIVERKAGWFALGAACLTALATYFLFEILLRAGLPQGIFEF